MIDDLTTMDAMNARTLKNDLKGERKRECKQAAAFNSTASVPCISDEDAPAVAMLLMLLLLLLRLVPFLAASFCDADVAPAKRLVCAASQPSLLHDRKTNDRRRRIGGMPHRVQERRLQTWAFRQMKTNLSKAKASMQLQLQAASRCRERKRRSVL